MKRMVKAESGISLVEVTIILLVLMLVTSVLAPSMYDFVNDARMVKVKEDCEAIGISVVRLVRDVGPCLKIQAGDNGCTALALYSRGNSGDGVTTLGWPVDANGSSMEEQFTTNQHGTTPATIYTTGWRGAYIPAPIGPDPWGTRYAVNSQYLDPSQNGDADVFCIAAGPNKKNETAFGGNVSGGTSKLGDDFVFVIAGSQRAGF